MPKKTFEVELLEGQQYQIGNLTITAVKAGTVSQGGSPPEGRMTLQIETEDPTVELQVKLDAGKETHHREIPQIPETPASATSTTE